MPQPQIRAQQLNSDDYNVIVEGALGATLVISSPILEGQTLTYAGSPLAWRNAVGGGGAGSVVAGDGLDSTAGAGSPFSGTFSVDSTVARLNVALNDYTFGGTVSLNLTDTTQSADEDTWRISNVGGQFTIATRTDVDGAGNNAIVIDRTGTTVDSVTSAAPVFITASGTGTSSGLQLNSNVPTIVFNDGDATASEGIWDITSTSASSALEFRTRTDAHGSGVTWLSVVRSGTTVTNIDFIGTSMTFNGVEVAVGSPVGSGGGGDPDQNIWLNMDADSGGPIAANTTSDTFTITGGAGISTAISGDVVTITNTGGVGSPVDPSVAILAGSPVTIINANSFAVNQTLRGYDSGNTDYIEMLHDGSSAIIDTNTSQIRLQIGETDVLQITSGGLQTVDGAVLSMYDSINTNSVIFAPAATEFVLRQSVGSIDTFRLQDLDLQIGGAGSPGAPDIILNKNGDSSFTGAMTLSKFWTGPGDGPIVLNSVGPTIEFTDTTTGDTALIEMSNTVLRFGTLSQGSPVGPGYDGLLTVGHGSGSPTSGFSLFDFAGYSGSFSLTGGNFDVSTSGNITLNAHTIANSLFVGTGSPALLSTQTTGVDGVLSSIKIQDAEGLVVDVGFNQMLWKVKNATMGTTDDDWRSHAGHVTISDDGSAYTWTTPASTDGVVPNGATYTLANVGAGNITIAAGSGVTMTWLDGDTGGTGSRTLAQYGVATLSKRSDTIWYVWGTGLT